MSASIDPFESSAFIGGRLLAFIGVSKEVRSGNSTPDFGIHEH